MVNLEINQTFELAETFGLLADTTRLSIVLEFYDILGCGCSVVESVTIPVLP